MYHSLGDSETYVSPYPLTDIIQFDSKRTDQILLAADTSSKKARKHSRCFTFSSYWSTCKVVTRFREPFWPFWKDGPKSDHQRAMLYVKRFLRLTLLHFKWIINI